jgi:hypothetical protein
MYSLLVCNLHNGIIIIHGKNQTYVNISIPSPRLPFVFRSHIFKSRKRQRQSYISQLFSGGLPAHIMKAYLTLILNFGNRWREEFSFMTRTPEPVLRHCNKTSTSPLQRIETWFLGLPICSSLIMPTESFRLPSLPQRIQINSG